MKHITTILFLLGISMAYSQLHPDTLLKKSKYYLRRNPDSSIFYLKQIKNIAERQNSDSLKASYSINMGTVSYYKGNYDSAILFWKQALSYKGENHETFHSFACNNVGVIYSFQRKNDSALVYLQRAVLLKEKLNDPSVGNTYNNLGEVNLNLGFNEKAREYFELGLRKKLENREESALGNSYLNLGRAYKRLYKEDSAIFYARKALKAFEKEADKKGIADAYNNIANYITPKDPDSAIYYFNESMKLKKELNNQSGLIANHLSITTLYIQLREWDAAKYHLDLAKPLVEKLKLPNEMSSILEREILIDSANARWYRAFLKTREQQALLDSIYDTDMAKTVKELESRFETEKKEKEIMLLAEQNKIKDLELANRKQLQLFLTILMLVIVIASGILVHTLRQKSKLREETLQSEINELRAEIQALLVKQNKSFDRPLQELNLELENPISDREYDVLQKIFTNKTNRQIADELYVSVNTIKTHLKNIYSKLGVSGRHEVLEKISKV